VRKKRICIIAFKEVRRSIDVLRQIDYLSPHYDLTVIGHGSPDPSWPVLAWHSVPSQTIASKIAKLFWFALGRTLPFFYEGWFWTTARYRLALKYAVSSDADAFHANDWSGLAVAVEAARRTKGCVVFHMQEYGEQESDNNILWRLLVAPSVRYFIKKYTSHPDVPIAASITVCEPIAERYRRERALDPIVVLNAPKPANAPIEADGSDAAHIRLIHHGYAKRGRGLHHMIRALALTDPRFILEFMLVEDNHGYVDYLRKLAVQLAPGRVRFRDPVRPWEIVRCISEYDMGLCVIEPSTYNNLMMLPNKLFEYIQGGLAVCIGPSPAMVDVVQRHGVGVAAPSFAPSDIAATLNRLTWQEIREMKAAARRAAAVLNADVEMAKVVELYGRLLDDRGGAAEGAGPGSPAGTPASQWEVASSTKPS
jgi:glycosyltransferase involved in cell wall biosynthesis